MQKINDLSILSEKPAAGGRMSRREAGRRLLAGIAASASLPFGTTAHPLWKHFEDEPLMQRAESAAPGGKPLFLNGQQFASLVAVAEAILPGSTKANVASFLDLLLSIEKEKVRNEFAASLARIESESSVQSSKTFSGLSATEKRGLLTSATETTDKSDPTLRDAFKNLKEWISGAYYSSEIGMRELGWTPDRVFAEFPGCSHTEGHD